MHTIENVLLVEKRPYQFWKQHISKYSSQGPHTISNGILLRSDLHKLFDSGYITITNDYRVQISKKIKEEFENGREYYRYHGQELLHLPLEEINKLHVNSSNGTTAFLKDNHCQLAVVFRK